MFDFQPFSSYRSVLTVVNEIQLVIFKISQINNVIISNSIIYKMWVSNNTLQQLKTQVIKAKSYKSKHRDVKQIQPYLSVFDKYFTTIKPAANFDKVVEYFVQVFVCCLNVMPNDRLYDCFKKLIAWLNQDKTKNKAYYLIKTVVEICERQFPSNKLNDKTKNKQKDEKKKDKQKQRELSKQRDFSSQRERKQRKQQNPSSQGMKQDLKAVLGLVRKSGQKNMLQEDVYAVFIDYYLQRVGEQMKSIKQKGGKGKEMEDATNENKQIKLGSHILSQLSTMLANRSKSNVGPVIQKHIANSSNSYICLYLLIQSKYIPHLILPAVSGLNANTQRNPQSNRVRHHAQITNAYTNYTNVINYDSSGISLDDEVAAFVIGQLLQLLARLLKNQQFAYIPQVYHLFPNGNALELNTSQQLLNRLYIHSSQGMSIKDPDILDRYKVSDWARWSKTFIENHAEYIQATKLSPNSYGKQGPRSIMSMSYVIKLYVMAAWLLKPTLLSEGKVKQLESGITRIIDRLLRQINSNNSHKMVDEQEENGNMKKLVYDQYQILYSDCLAMIPAHCPTTYRQTTSEQTDMQGRLIIHKRQQTKWKQLIQQLSSTADQHERVTALQTIKQLLKHQDKSNQTPIFQHWRVAMEILFDLTLSSMRQSKSNHNSEQIQELYSKQAMHAMAALNLNPPLLAKLKFEKRDQLLQISSIDNACVQVLYAIVVGADKDELISHIKKLMSQAFDRVEQSAIRNVITNNLFLSKCLLMTNHPVKCKILMEELIRHHQAQALRNKETRVQKYLQALLIGVPKQLLVQYSKYIASKDKLQMRYFLFEKQALNLQYLLDADLFDLATKLQMKLPAM